MYKFTKGILPLAMLSTKYQFIIILNFIMIVVLRSLYTKKDKFATKIAYAPAPKTLHRLYCDACDKILVY